MEPIEYQTVLNEKTGVTHYVRPVHILDNISWPACGNTINNEPEGSCDHYSFSRKPATCKKCTASGSWFMRRRRPRVGWWSEQIAKAILTSKTQLCPFQLFAKKYDYDLKHDRLFFPNTALEFDAGIGYNLPNNVHIDCVSTRNRTYHDKVLLVKFMACPVDGLVVPWELIVKPWPEGSHCDVSFVTKTVRGKATKGPKPPKPMDPWMKEVAKHTTKTPIFGAFK